MPTIVVIVKELVILNDRPELLLEEWFPIASLFTFIDPQDGPSSIVFSVDVLISDVFRLG